MDALKDPTIRKLADRVTVVESEEFNVLRQTKHLSGARVTVKWNDGTSSAAMITNPKGALGNPLSEEDVVNKFLTLSSPALGPDGAHRLLKLVMEGPEDTPISQLITLLVPNAQ